MRYTNEINTNQNTWRGRRGRDRMVVGQPMQALPITTDVANSLLIRAMCTKLLDKVVSDL